MFTKGRTWICVFERNGARHVLRATSAAAEEKVRRHLQQTHRDMRIIELRPGTVEEFNKLKAELEATPGHVPLTQEDVNEGNEIARNIERARTL